MLILVIRLSLRNVAASVESTRAPCAGSGHFVTCIGLRVVLPMVVGPASVPTNGRIAETFLTTTR